MKRKRNLIQLCLLGALMWPAFSSSAQTVTQIAAGGYHSLFLKSDGSLWAMGLDFYGELGDGVIRPVSPYATNQPEMILGPNLTRTVTAIAAGYEHSLFLKDDDSFWAMGYNNVGELGNSSTNYSLIPLIILPGSTAVVVTNISTEAGGEHDLILKSDGSLWAVGLNSYGQLGNNTENNYFTTPQLIVPSGVTAISAGAYHSLFLKTGGSMWAMGLNSHGQLGDGTSDNGFFETNSPEMIVPSGVTAISAGGYHSLFLKNDGSLWGMGTNGDGELGDGTLFQKISPEMIVSSNVTAIAAGGYFSLFLKNDGSLWGMGKNEHGQLGDGTYNSVYTPEMIVSNGVVAIAAGGGHSLFIKSDGSLWGMGYNNYGQLGIGTYISTNRPVLIVPGSGASSPIAYNFTVTTAHDGTSITLKNVYIIDVEPHNHYASITPIVGPQGQINWTSGSQIAGTIPGGLNTANNLILIAVYTDAQDATNGVAISLPSSLATNYISIGETWNQFNNSTNFPFGLLPDEPTTLSDLQTESQNTLQSTLVYFSFNYLPSTNPIVELSGQNGTIVAFSSAQSIGSFSFVPQPALSITSGGGNVTVQWPTNAPGFTLAQSTNLSAGAWSDVTTVKTVIKTNYSVTLPANTTNQFFQLHEP